MALNRRFVGRKYPPTEPYEVGREKIREFAAAVGEDSAACYDVATAVRLGHPDLIAPPTFAIVLSMRADEQVVRDAELGLDYSKVVHREQRFTHHRPVCAGDALTVVVTVRDIRTIAGNELLITTGEITTVAGEPVCTTSTTLVARVSR
jgi:acyl dehydratase